MALMQKLENVTFCQ